MATCAAASSLMLTYASSAVCHQDLNNPSLLSFKSPNPLLKPPSLCSLVLSSRGVRSSKCVSLYSQECYGVRSRSGASLVVAAVAAEAEVAEEGVEEEGGAVSTVAPPKPKKGKAALPLKRDRTRSKRFLEIQKLRENKKEYDLKTAISLLKRTSGTKFVETVEAHFRLNIDPKYNDQQLRATVNLPKGTGQTVRVAVLTQ
ncbi:hypothetical protein CRG98_016593, partial [Punica granatum]